MKARTITQKRFVELLTKKAPTVVIASGPAGSGKTLLSTYVGIQQLFEKKFERLIYTRPSVCVDEDLGTLPGTLDKKIEPFMTPFTEILSKYFNKYDIDRMFKNKIIEIVPIGYMRGRTIDNSFLICDESQNCTPRQLMMLLTRIGENNKVVLAGDPIQYDANIEDKNGLLDLMKRIDNKVFDEIELIKLSEVDVQRHPVVKQVIELYK